MMPIANDLLAAAHRLNTYFAVRLGALAPFADPATPPEGHIARIAQLQRQSGCLLVDGVLGSKTRAYLQRKTWQPPAAHYLWIAGAKVATPFPTVPFTDQAGLSFYDQGGWLPRDRVDGRDIDLLVLHWDECISSTHCFGVLLQRGLSVHLMLDADGTVYQGLDLAQARAWHARAHNERSVGIEIQNAVWPRPELAGAFGRDWTNSILPHTGAPFGHSDFTLAQKTCLKVLIPWLCDTLHIPLQVPRTAAGTVPSSLCALPFAGVCGHYHLQTDKIDPGLTLWPLIEGALAPPPVA